REEIFVLLLGPGGNGKGVLKETPQAATGDYYGTMSKDAIVKAPGQHAPSKNAPTNYIFELMGVRLAVTDETAKEERVDLGLVLAMTGGGSTKARGMRMNNVEFVITHTPFVQTNYPPVMLATEIKDNVLRRLRTVLVLLPKAVRDATDEYVREADKLQLFLDQHCERGEGLSTLQIEFATLYREFASERLSNEELARRMDKKGFRRLKNNESPRQFFYPGIKCSYTI
ncbi:hypothetical protein KFL_009960010, partial [Klebsormidium nitens]